MVDITIKNTTEDVDTLVNEPLTLQADAIELAFDEWNYIIGNNSSKKITASYVVKSNSAISATAVYCYYGLDIAGRDFLYTINASANNSGRGQAFAYGISAGIIYASAKITKAITVSAASAASTAKATGIYSSNEAYFDEGITGKISVSATSKDDVATAAGIEAHEIYISNGGISGKITVSATGNSENEDVYAYGVFGKGITYISTFNSQLTVSAKNNETCHAFGFYTNADSSLQINRINNGNINVSATSTDGEANAYGLWGGAIGLHNFNCAMTVSATSKNDNAWAIAIKAFESGIYFSGDIEKAISVSAKNIRATESYATNAVGFDGGSFGADNISAKISITSQNEGDSFATAFDMDGYIDVRDITGNISATAINKEHYGRENAYASVFTSYNSYFSAGIISGTLSATANNGEATAVCIDAAGGLSIRNMEKAKINVTAKSTNNDSSAWGIYSEAGGFQLSSTADFSFGKIFVSASSKGNYESFACGISVAGRITSDGGSESWQIISGDITVKSTGSAYGIRAQSIDSKSAINLVVSGKEYAYGYVIGGGTLILENAKVKAYVTDKDNKDNAYAVYAMDVVDDYCQNIYITGKSNVTGHIYLGLDYDTVFIESGSKLRGALVEVDKLVLDVSDSSNQKTSLWDAVECADMTQTELEINFDYGMTGDFLLCTKESSIQKWTDIFYENIVVSYGELQYAGASFDLNQRYNKFSDSFYEFELKADGDKLILSVTDIS